MLDAVDRYKWLARLADAAVARPRTVFWWFLVLHTAIWSLSSIALWPNLPDDPMEMLYVGREWQLGFYKLPPLPAWIAVISDIATFGAHWTPLVVAQLLVASSFWVIWRFVSELLGEVRALVAVVALAGVAASGHEGMKLNHDVTQYPFWALTGWWLYRALRGERMRDWGLLGVAMGFGMMAKYQFAVHLLPLAIFAVLHPASRPCLRTKGPYFAVAVASLIMLPNIAWLLVHDFLGPWKNATGGMRSYLGAWGHIIHPFNFAEAQASIVGCAVASLLALRGRSNQIAPLPDLTSFDRWYVAVLALGPFLLVEVGQAIVGVGARPTWGFSMWGYLGAFGVVTLAPSIDRSSLRRFFAVSIALFVAVFAVTAILENVVQPYRGRPSQVHFPGAAVAASIESKWREETSGARLRYVVGDVWFAGNIATYASDRPSVFVDATPAFSAWVDQADLRRRGAVIIWSGRADRRVPPPRHYAARFPDMQIQPLLVLPHRTWVPSPPAYVEWAIVPPRGE